MNEEVKSILSGDVFIQVVTEGKVLPSLASDGGNDDYWGGFGSLSFRKEYRFYRHQDYFTLKLRLDWKGNNTKIAIRFPRTVIRSTRREPMTSFRSAERNLL